MNVVIYARFSSHNQREESIEGQVRSCRAFAETHNMTVIGIYADRGISGRSVENRTEFQRMIADSEKHKFEAVLMWNLDRFARNRYDAATYKAKLKKNGVRLFYSEQGIPDTPEGIILESVLEGFAEYYSENLSRNAKRGLQENAMKCLWNGGCIPLGYIIDDSQHFQIEPVSAGAVLLIFEKYAAGESIKSIVCFLNEKGYKTVKGNAFRLGSIQSILRNRKYIGEYTASGITTPHGIPAIIPEDLFNRVQAKIKTTSRAKGHNKADIPYLLTSKVFCGHCGSPMIGESGTGKGGSTYRYYKCACRKNRKGHCTKKTEQKEWLEELVVSETVKRILVPKTINEIAETAAALLKKESQDNSFLLSLQSQLADTEKALKNLLSAIEQGIILETTKKRMEELENLKSELKTQIAHEELKKPVIDKQRIAYWLLSFAKGNIKDTEYQQRVIDMLVSRVDIFDDGPDKRKIIFTFNLSENNTAEVTCSDIKGSALPIENWLHVDQFFFCILFTQRWTRTDGSE